MKRGGGGGKKRRGERMIPHGREERRGGGRDTAGRRRWRKLQSNRFSFLRNDVVIQSSSWRFTSYYHRLSNMDQTMMVLENQQNLTVLITKVQNHFS